MTVCHVRSGQCDQNLSQVNRGNKKTKLKDLIHLKDEYPPSTFYKDKYFENLRCPSFFLNTGIQCTLRRVLKMCNILKAHVSQLYKPISLFASILHISL